MDIVKRNSVLKLHGEVACAPLDLWLARWAGNETERDVHFYVGDRYWQLAEHYKERGWLKTAMRLRLKAEYHLRLSGWNDTPPAVAVAFSVPRPRIFTKAVGWRPGKRRPDSAE